MQLMYLEKKFYLTEHPNRCDNNMIVKIYQLHQNIFSTLDALPFLVQMKHGAL